MKFLKTSSIFGLVLLISLVLAPPALAEVQEIVAEGSYNMGDRETPAMAEGRALLEAKRIAIEQAGTYVESYTEVKNFKLTRDEITSIASGIMETSILEKRRTVVGTTFVVTVKIKAKITTDDIEVMAQKIYYKKNPQKVEDVEIPRGESETRRETRALLYKQSKEN